MATIKLSKQQWEFIGKKAGWIKKAVYEPDFDETGTSINSRSRSGRYALTTGYNKADVLGYFNSEEDAIAAADSKYSGVAGIMVVNAVEID